MWIEQKDEEKDLSQNQPNPSIGAGAGIAPVPIQGSTTPSTGTLSSTNPTPTTPGQKFGTIQDYLSANQQQGETLGEKFSSKLGEEKQQQQQQIGEAANAAQNKVAANTIGYNQDLITKAVTDPTKVAGDAGDFDKFMQQWSATYKGPQAFEETPDYEKAAKAANEARSRAEQLGTAGGRQQLLQTQFGPQSAGNAGLDEALLQHSSSFGKVGQQAKEFNALQDYLSGQSKEVESSAKKAKETTEQTRQKAHEAFSPLMPKLTSDITGRLTQAEQEREAYNKQAAATRDWANELNAIFASQNPNYKQDLESYLKTPSNVTPPTAGTIATQAERDRLAALQKLTGETPSIAINPSEKAGSYTSLPNLSTNDKVVYDKFVKQGYNDNTARKLTVAENLADKAMGDVKDYMLKKYPEIFNPSHQKNPKPMTNKEFYNTVGGMIGSPFASTGKYAADWQKLRSMMEQLNTTVPELFVGGKFGDGTNYYQWK